MNKYLVIIESSKNNISNHGLHILRTSGIVNANSFEDAEKQALEEYNKGYRGSISKTNHFGYEPDSVYVIDIKKLD